MQKEQIDTHIQLMLELLEHNFANSGGIFKKLSDIDDRLSDAIRQFKLEDEKMYLEIMKILHERYVLKEEMENQFKTLTKEFAAYKLTTPTQPTDKNKIAAIGTAIGAALLVIGQWLIEKGIIHVR